MWILNFVFATFSPFLKSGFSEEINREAIKSLALRDHIAFLLKLESEHILGTWMVNNFTDIRSVLYVWSGQNRNIEMAIGGLVVP